MRDPGLVIEYDLNSRSWKEDELLHSYLDPRMACRFFAHLLVDQPPERPSVVQKNK